MSDISTDPDLAALAASGALDPDPPTPDPQPDLPPAASDDAEPSAENTAEWIAYGRRMAKESQARREKYQPIERTLGALPPESADAILGFAGALASGDTAAAVNWLATNASALAGDDLVDQLEAAGLTRKQAVAASAAADQVAATQQGEQPDAAERPLTREEALELIREENRREQEQQAKWNASLSEANAAFAEIGIDPLTPAGQMVRDAASHIYDNPANKGMPLSAAIKAGHEVVQRNAREILRQQFEARQAAGSGPVPQGGALGQEVGLPVNGRDAAQRRMQETMARLASPDR